MTVLFHILSGTRLELLLGVLAALWLYYSPDLRETLGRLPFLRAAMGAKDKEQLAMLKTLHGNAYALLVMLLRRLTASLLYGAAFSVAVLVGYNIASYLQMTIVENTHVENLAAALVLAGPLLGLILFVFWLRRLLAELSEYDRAVTALRAEEKPRLQGRAA